LGANLILYCIIKAFSKAKASDLAPLRYLELVFSSLIGYLVFNEALSPQILFGGSLVVIASIILTTNHGKK
jgi:S-adenosylmethionine uptake transporter